MEHAVLSLLPMSNPVYLIIILSNLSAILSGRVWVFLGMPELSTFYRVREKMLPIFELQ